MLKAISSLFSALFFLSSSVYLWTLQGFSSLIGSALIFSLFFMILGFWHLKVFLKDKKQKEEFYPLVLFAILMKLHKFPDVKKLLFYKLIIYKEVFSLSKDLYNQNNPSSKLRVFLDLTVDDVLEEDVWEEIQFKYPQKFSIVKENFEYVKNLSSMEAKGLL